MSRLDKDRERFVAFALWKVGQLDAVILAGEKERTGWQAVIDAAKPTQESYGVGGPT